MVFDEIEEKEMSAEAAQIWLLEHEDVLDRYLDNNWSIDSYDEILDWCLENPKLVVPLLQDEDEYESIKIERIINIFKSNTSTIAIIFGARGEGKTATGYWISEEVHKWGKEVYYIAPAPDLQMPDFMHYATDPSQTPDGCLIIMDESGIQLSARTSATERQQELAAQLQVFRHSDKSILFITQHTALL